jgi:malate synthase
MESTSGGAAVGEVFDFIREVPRDAARHDQAATVLIETILAAFEMDEILWELKDYIRGLELRPLGLHLQLHQGFRASDPTAVLPDRGQRIDMTTHFPALVLQLLCIKTCHRRGAFAMGGMAAQIPSRTIRSQTKRRWKRCARTRSAR